jgi:hypothetical protein
VLGRRVLEGTQRYRKNVLEARRSISLGLCGIATPDYCPGDHDLCLIAVGKVHIAHLFLAEPPRLFSPAKLPKSKALGKYLGEPKLQRV